MSKLIVRLLASGAIVSGMGAPVLADSASIGDTGPHSINIIAVSNQNSFTSLNENLTNLQNLNRQTAASGNIWVVGNTWVGGGVVSGEAFNSNQTQTDVVNTNGALAPVFVGQGTAGDGSATIWATGSGSLNRIVESNSNCASRTNINATSVGNFSQQQARSGGVVLAGNTNVVGPVSSGQAVNENATENTITNTNNGSLPVVGLGSSGGSASIGDTGPGSVNTISETNSATFRSLNDNQTNVTNSNNQSATSGNVVIRDNTNVGGPVTSGDAVNTNTTTTTVSNNN